MSHKWDLRYLEMAKVVASWSRDPSTKCGAVIVRPDNTVASVGFNGFPAVLTDFTYLYNNRDEKYPRIEHAELNAIAHAQGAVHGFTMYNWPVAPCNRCALHALTFGITRFVYPVATPDFLSRWLESLKTTKTLFHEASASISYDEYNQFGVMQHNTLSTVNK